MKYIDKIKIADNTAYENMIHFGSMDLMVTKPNVEYIMLLHRLNGKPLRIATVTYNATDRTYTMRTCKNTEYTTTPVNTLYEAYRQLYERLDKHVFKD